MKAFPLLFAVALALLTVLWSFESVQARDREKESRDWFECIKTKPVVNCYG